MTSTSRLYQFQELANAVRELIDNGYHFDQNTDENPPAHTSTTHRATILSAERDERA